MGLYAPVPWAVRDSAISVRVASERDSSSSEASLRASFRVGKSTHKSSSREHLLANGGPQTPPYRGFAHCRVAEFDVKARNEGRMAELLEGRCKP